MATQANRLTQTDAIKISRYLEVHASQFSKLTIAEIVKEVNNKFKLVSTPSAVKKFMDTLELEYKPAKSGGFSYWSEKMTALEKRIQVLEDLLTK